MRAILRHGPNGTENGWLGKVSRRRIILSCVFQPRLVCGSARTDRRLCRRPRVKWEWAATAQIQQAADRLGLPLHGVTFQYGDSSLPDTPMLAGGSNQTATTFAAVRAAVEQVHRELLK